MTSFSTGDGWRMEYPSTEDGVQAPDGGLVLRNVRHGDNPFANDIRVVGIRLRFKSYRKDVRQPDRHLYLPLIRERFTFGAIETLDGSKTPPPAPNPVMYDVGGNKARWDALSATRQLRDDTARKSKQAILDQLGRFGTYGYTSGLRIAYYSNQFDAVIKNPDYKRLMVTQTFLFTRYGMEPPHDPGGLLAAARIFPLVRFQLFDPATPDTSDDERHVVRSVRVDYRFHLSMNGPNRTGKDRPNQAAAFQDEDSLDVVAGAAQATQFNSQKMVSRGGFDVAEKPLVKEIAAYGLIQGRNTVRKATPTKGAVRSWDNLHWWAGYGYVNIPSAPGAANAIHLHWRWGKAGKHTPFGDLPQFKAFTAVDPKVAGVPVPVSIEVPGLVNPSNWIQTVRFAVALYDPNTDPALVEKDPSKRSDTGALCRPNFFDLFTATPAQTIEAGANIVLWYSVEVLASSTATAVWDEPPSKDQPAKSRSKDVTVTAKLDGTVFIHGLYFAHNSEKELAGMFGSPRWGVGPREPEYFPDGRRKIATQRTWARYGR